MFPAEKFVTALFELSSTTGPVPPAPKLKPIRAPVDSLMPSTTLSEMVPVPALSVDVPIARTVELEVIW